MTENGGSLSDKEGATGVPQPETKAERPALRVSMKEIWILVSTVAVGVAGAIYAIFYFIVQEEPLTYVIYENIRNRLQNDIELQRELHAEIFSDPTETFRTELYGILSNLITQRAPNPIIDRIMNDDGFKSQLGVLIQSQIDLQSARIVSVAHQESFRLSSESDLALPQHQIPFYASNGQVLLLFIEIEYFCRDEDKIEWPFDPCGRQHRVHHELLVEYETVTYDAGTVEIGLAQPPYFTQAMKIEDRRPVSGQGIRPITDSFSNGVRRLILSIDEPGDWRGDSVYAQVDLVLLVVGHPRPPMNASGAGAFTEEAP